MTKMATQSGMGLCRTENQLSGHILKDRRLAHGPFWHKVNIPDPGWGSISCIKRKIRFSEYFIFLKLMIERFKEV